MDIYCSVCSEPWDAWGANHGDMATWEYDLFKKGKGCPCCKGIRPNGVNAEQAIETRMQGLLFHGPDDPDAFGLATCDLDPIPSGDGSEWKEPEPKKLWTCHGCGVSVVINNEAPYDGSQVEKDKIWLEWYGGERVHYIGSNFLHSYASATREDPTRKPEYTLENENYCPGCATSCRQCRKTILVGSHCEPTDCYDPGYSFPHPDNPFYGSVCLECFQELSTCDGCGNCHDDCTCEDE